MKDIYLNENGSPLFYKSEEGKTDVAFLGEEDSKLMTFRNLVNAEINTKFSHLVKNLEDFTSEVKLLFKYVILAVARSLNIEIDQKSLNKLEYEKRGDFIVVKNLF